MNRPSYTRSVNHLGHTQYFNVDHAAVCVECEKLYVNQGEGVICAECDSEESLKEKASQ